MTVDPWSTEDGYLVVDLIDPHEAAELRAEAHERWGTNHEGFHASSAQAPRARAAAIDAWSKARLAPALEHLLPHHRPFLAALISKAARHGGPVSFHQDWTYTDERHHRATLAWVPLVDVDESSGALRMVPGSHRWSSGIRPAGAELPTEPLQAELAERAVTVPMRAGQAMVYDPAVVHGSWPNRRAVERTVVAIASAPSEAPLLHFHADGTHGLRGFEISASYYVDQDFAAIPDGPQVPPWAEAVTSAELRRGLR